MLRITHQVMTAMIPLTQHVAQSLEDILSEEELTGVVCFGNLRMTSLTLAGS